MSGYLVTKCVGRSNRLSSYVVWRSNRLASYVRSHARTFRNILALTFFAIKFCLYFCYPSRLWFLLHQRWHDMSQARPAKRQRLDGELLLGQRRISCSIVEAVLASLPSDQGITRSAVRYNMRVGANKLYNSDVERVIVLKLKDGSDFDWHIASPQGLLRMFTSRSESLQRLLRGCRSSVHNPSNLVVYHDEATPGNLLAAQNALKCYAFRFTIKELGKVAIYSQAFQFEFAILRSRIASTVVGGISDVLRRLMHEFFTSPESFLYAGVALQTGLGPELFFAKLGSILGDYPALSMSYDMKGHGGTKPCAVLCSNVLAKDALTCPEAPIPNESGTLVDVACTSYERFIFNSDAEVWTCIDRLASAKARLLVGEFKTLEMAYGFTHNPQGMLADMQLRPIVSPTQTFTWDWAHVFLSNGIGGVEL